MQSHLSEFWEYDPTTNLWSQKADVPGPGRTEAVEFSNGICGYIGLGISRGGALDDFWEYTPGSSSVPTLMQTNLVTLYPNPVTDNLNIETSNPGLMSYSIYNVNGKFIKSGSITDRFITGSDIPAGLYFLKLTFANQTITKKFIKE